MAALATQAINRGGIVPTYAAAAGGGDTFLPDAHTFLHFKNGSATPRTVTVVTPGTDQIGNAVADTTVSVDAVAEEMLGPFPAPFYADPVTGVASITYSGVTSLTLAVLIVSQP